MADRMPERMSDKMTECIYILIYIYIYVYTCHIEWMSDRMSNRISWFMPERKSNRASEYINISAIYNSRWYARNCVTIASRVASFEVKIVHVPPLVSQKVVETKNNIYIYTYDDNNMPVIVGWRGSIVYATNVWSIFLPWIKSWFHQRASNDRTVRFVGLEDLCRSPRNGIPPPHGSNID